MIFRAEFLNGGDKGVNEDSSVDDVVYHWYYKVISLLLFSHFCGKVSV